MPKKATENMITARTILGFCDTITMALVALNVDEVKLCSSINAALGRMQLDGTPTPKLGAMRLKKAIATVTQTTTEKYLGHREIALDFLNLADAMAKIEKVHGFSKGYQFPNGQPYTEWLLKHAGPPKVDLKATKSEVPA